MFFNVGATTDDNTQTIDWALLKPTLRPATLGQAAWDALYPNLTAQLGRTWGAYLKQLDADARYLHDNG